jgi:hypothetical protein
MPRFRLRDIERHWRTSALRFDRGYGDWDALYRRVLEQAAEVLATLEGHRRLAENCAYLLLAKGLNHSLSSFTLARRGMLIDAAACVRHQAETLWFLQLASLDEEERLFAEWTAGRTFRPAWVREQLETHSAQAVRDVIVSFGPDLADDRRFSYSWLSQLSHPNLESLSYTVDRTREGYIVNVGGRIVEGDPVVRAVLAVNINELHWSTVISAAVFNLPHLETKRDAFTTTHQRLRELMKTTGAPRPNKPLQATKGRACFRAFCGFGAPALRA